MNIYIEALEDTTGKGEDYVGDFIQEEIREGDTDKKALDKVKLKEKAGKKYKYRKHFHYHEEDVSLNKPCVVEDIK